MKLGMGRVVAAALGVAQASFGFGAGYSLIDLGSLSGHGSTATDVNNLGQVVGTSTAADGQAHAFLYTDGRMVDLGVLPSGSLSCATAINDAGTIVGYSNVWGMGSYIEHPFVYSDGQMKDLLTLMHGYELDATTATGVNNRGDIVGFDYATQQGYIYSNGAQYVVSSTYSNICPVAVSSAGVVLAVNRTDGKVYTGGIQGPRGLARVPGINVAVGPGPSNKAIDTIDRIVGYSGNHAVFYAFGVINDLGSLNGDPSAALAINLSGEIVGYSGNRGFIYTDNRMQDLTTLLDATGGGWTITNAVAINDLGQIVAQGISPTGQVNSVLLTRSTVPEPVSLIGLGVGGLWLVARKQRKR